MHKPIYASGFLYHPTTHQILLQQAITQNNEASPLTLFYGVGRDGESPRDTFIRVLSEKLHIELKEKNVFPVYDYVSERLHQKNVHVFYGHIRRVEDFPPLQGIAFSWHTFKQIGKLLLEDQARQDIMVSERVIHAAERVKASIHVVPTHIQFPKLFH